MPLFSSPIAAYVQLPFTTNPDDLADAALAFLQANWPDWEPDEADMAVLLIEALAPMAANAAQIAANMPPAALIALGTELLGLEYQPGVPASANATFTVQDANGPYTIDSGSEVDISGIAFTTNADLTIPNGQTTGTITVTATLPGTFANGFDGTDWASGNLPVFVTDFSISTPTSGGIDPQDDADFLNAVARELQLRSKSVITLVDMEIVAVNTDGIGRAVFVAQGSHPRNIDGYVTDPEGEPVASGIKTDLLTQLNSPDIRMVNAVITVNDPDYTTVKVTYEALSLPGVDATGLATSTDAALEAELSPEGWGAPTISSPGLSWVDQPVVHVNRLIGVVSGVKGVDYILSLALSADKVATLGVALTTGAGTTTVHPAALVNVLPAGSYTITDPTGAHTDTFVTTGSNGLGATSMTITAHTFSFAYPIGSTIGGAVTGDLTMRGGAAGALPQPGTMTATIDTPTT